MMEVNKYIAEERRELRREPQSFFSAYLFFLRASLRYILCITTLLIITTQNLYAQEFDTTKRDHFIKQLDAYEKQKKELRQAQYIPADTQKANLLWQINYYDDYSKNPKEYVARLTELKEIANALNYKKGIANALFGEGLGLSFKQEYEKGLELQKKALEIRQEINDAWGISWSCFYIGAGYQWQNLNKEAMPWYIKGLKLGEEAKDSILLYNIYCGLSGIYANLEDVKQAIECAEKSAAFANRPSNKLQYGWALSFLSTYYAYNKEFAKADSVLLINKNIATEQNNFYSLSYYYSSKAGLEELRGNYGEAILAYINSNSMEDSMKGTNNKPYSLSSIANNILKADKHQLAIAGIAEAIKYDEVIRYSQLSLDITIPSNIMGVTASNYSNLSTAYEAKGNMTQAFKYFKMSTKINDSLYSAENTKTIQSLKMQYESEQQQQQIATLTKDKQLHQAEALKHKTQRNIFIAASALVLLLIGFIVNRYQVKSKATAEIEKTYNHLLQTQQQLVQSGKLAALGKMTAEVGSRIKEPIEKVKTLSPQGTLLANEYENATTTRKTEILQQLKLNLTEINTNGTQANEIVKDVLMQTRKQTA